MATLAFLDDPAVGPAAVAAAAARRATGPSGVLTTVGDPEGTRTVTAIVALLVALGVAMVMITVWLYRTTRPDPKLLAPLEAMGERTWRRADPVWQRRRLDELRPDGAEPLAPAVAPPELDTTFDAGPAATGFDDLHDNGDAADVASDADPDSDPDATVAVDPRPTPPRPIEAIVFEPPPADADRAPIATPLGIARPATLPRDGSSEPVSAELLARAMAELDAEMDALAARRLERAGERGAEADPDPTGLTSQLDRGARHPEPGGDDSDDSDDRDDRDVS